MKCNRGFIAAIIAPLSFFFLFHLASAAKGTEMAPGLGKDNILRCGLHVSKMGKLDPHFAAGSQDRAFADMVFNGLLRYEPGNAPAMEPDLADSMPTFEMIGGKQVWTVHLRQGVMFQKAPGVPSHELTADDVVYSFQKAADSSFSAYAGDYHDMVVSKFDRYSVRITLEHPLSPILFFPKIANYSGGFIVSKQAVEIMGYEGFAQHPVGTGPFAFKEYIPGKKLILTAHREYFRGAPKLDGVELHLLPKDTKRAEAFKSGLVDVITSSASKGWLADVQTLNDVVMDQFGVGEVNVFHMNISIPPLDDIRVRKAIAYALDRDMFLDTGNRDAIQPIFSFVPEKYLPGGLSEAEIMNLGLDYRKDLAKARELMSDAGLAGGFTLELVSSEKRIYRSLYESLKQQLAAINVDIKLTVMPHADMHKSIRNNPQAIVLYIAWRPNADVYLTRFFHSASTIVTGANPDTNFSTYHKADQLIEQARLETDPQKQIQLWQQVQILILDDMAAFPVMISSQQFVRKSYIEYGHVLKNTMALYPQFTEKTSIKKTR